MISGEAPYVRIEIGDSVAGDMVINGRNIVINIGGSVEGSLTVKQTELFNPEDVLVTVGGEQIHPEPD
jgi:hypothetical protein